MTVIELLRQLRVLEDAFGPDVELFTMQESADGPYPKVAPMTSIEWVGLDEYGDLAVEEADATQMLLTAVSDERVWAAPKGAK